jgi:NAD-dependent dihydropyrimidine dehydrogenase PreA subunit
VDVERCVVCGTCEKSCPYGAIHMDKDEKTLEIDEEKCFRCGLCASRCKMRALAMGQTSCVGEQSA